jgi:hypothetical protein
MPYEARSDDGSGALYQVGAVDDVVAGASCRQAPLQLHFVDFAAALDSEDDLRPARAQKERGYVVHGHFLVDQTAVDAVNEVANLQVSSRKSFPCR